MHDPYTQPIEFATFSQTVVITSLNKAKHHSGCHRNSGSVLNVEYKNSSGDEIANVNFYAVHPEATRIR